MAGKPTAEERRKKQKEAKQKKIVLILVPVLLIAIGIQLPGSCSEAPRRARRRCGLCPRRPQRDRETGPISPIAGAECAPAQ